IFYLCQIRNGLINQHLYSQHIQCDLLLKSLLYVFFFLRDVLQPYSFPPFISVNQNGKSSSEISVTSSFDSNGSSLFPKSIFANGLSLLFDVLLLDCCD